MGTWTKLTVRGSEGFLFREARASPTCRLRQRHQGTCKVYGLPGTFAVRVPESCPLAGYTAWQFVPAARPVDFF